MPFGREGVEEQTGLALSGGGFRAALFHAGALWRLAELGALGGLARVSSVSGGSIVAGVLAVRWAALRDAGFAVDALVRQVVDPLRRFCGRTVDVPAVLKGVLLPFRSVGDVLAGAYAEHLFGERTLQDLPDVPRFVFDATNLASGVGFRFSKPYAGDYRIGLVERPDFRIATAVAASSAFPPVLSPVVLDVDPKRITRTPGADLHDRVAKDGIRLTDGGVYDNMGLEPVWKRCRTVLVSDAGEPFAAGGRQASDWIRQTMRALAIIGHQARAQRRRALVQAYVARERLGAYWGIQTEIDRYTAPGLLPVPREVTWTLAHVRTRLDRFDEREQCSLVNWGYAVSDAAMRTFVTPHAAPPAAWPYPQWRLDRPEAGAVPVDDALDLDPEG